jgi:glycosyltransferase involved in cell wall biosynthesis
MTAPSISLCMIVRDEARCLGRCLASVVGVVDELVVVDTGSRDATVAIARDAGARVEHFEWRDDFAAARNCALGHARGEWVLALDADEVLEGGGARERLLAFAARAAQGMGGQVELENRLSGGRRSRLLLTRFFPRRAEVRYHRRVHEELRWEEHPLIGQPTGVRVLHDGYADEVMAARGKTRRNEELLRAQLAATPHDGYDWYQLGRTLEVAGRFEEALEAYERAVELVGDADAHLPHLFECAATCLRALGRSRQALEWLANIEVAFAERADTVFLLALLAMDLGELERAERGFRRCLDLGAHARPTSLAESSLEASGVAPAHNLGVLYEFSGRPNEAGDAYRQALAFDPEHTGARAGIERLAAALSIRVGDGG